MLLCKDNGFGWSRLTAFLSRNSWIAASALLTLLPNVRGCLLRLNLSNENFKFMQQRTSSRSFRLTFEDEPNSCKILFVGCWVKRIHAVYKIYDSLIYSNSELKYLHECRSW